MFKILLWLYQLIRAIRYVLLMSVLGKIPHCKYTPTCGTLMLSAIRDKSWQKMLVAIKQVLRCW